MAPAYVTYLKQVKGGLRCSRAEQKRLITALKEEILDTFPDADHAALAQIEEEYGPPEIMAQELQQVLPGGADAAAKKRTRKICLMLLLGLLAVVLIAGGIIYREHIKAGNTPPDGIVVTQPPEFFIITPKPPVSELPPASVPPEEQRQRDAAKTAIFAKKERPAVGRDVLSVCWENLDAPKHC